MTRTSKTSLCPSAVAAAAMVAMLPMVASAATTTTTQATATLPAATGNPPVANTVTPRPAASAATRSAQASGPATPQAGGRPLVALDAGHSPGEGSRSAGGMPEHNFNLRFAEALDQQLRARHIGVRRLPTTMSLADRVKAAQGSSMVLSVHHDATTPAPAAAGVARGVQPVADGAAGKVAVSPGSGYVLTIAQHSALSCAQALGRQLQATGRPFATPANLHSVKWADKGFGVRGLGEGALLQQAAVPVVKLSLADIANPREERLAADPAWVTRQAAAVARAIAQCLGPAPPVVDGA